MKRIKVDNLEELIKRTDEIAPAVLADVAKLVTKACVEKQVQPFMLFSEISFQLARMASATLVITSEMDNDDMRRAYQAFEEDLEQSWQEGVVQGQQSLDFARDFLKRFSH